MGRSFAVGRPHTRQRSFIIRRRDRRVREYMHFAASGFEMAALAGYIKK